MGDRGQGERRRDEGGEVVVQVRVMAGWLGRATRGSAREGGGREVVSLIHHTRSLYSNKYHSKREREREDTVSRAVSDRNTISADLVPLPSSEGAKRETHHPQA